MKQCLFLYNSPYFNHLLTIHSKKMAVTDSHANILQCFQKDEPIKVDTRIINFFSDLTSSSHQIAFRRLSGAAKLPGLLDTLRNRNIDVILAPLTRALKKAYLLEESNFIIAPLEMQTVPELYQLARDHEKPVFPLTFSDWLSKCVTKLAFQPVSVPSVFLPSSTPINTDFQLEIKSFFSGKFNDPDLHVIIKDDEGFHSGVTIPYMTGSLSNVGQLLKFYENRTDHVVIEPLIYESSPSSTITRLLKIHAFNSIVTSEMLFYNVRWKQLTGKFGPDMITIDSSGVLDEVPENFPLDETNALIKKYLPFNMVSLDFAYYPLGKKWYCIDINHSCGSWGEVQEMKEPDSMTIFDQMVNMMLDTDYRKHQEIVDKARQDIPGRPDCPVFI